MKIPGLKSCCYCIPLTAGVKVIGFLSLVACLFLIPLELTHQFAYVQRYGEHNFWLWVDIFVQVIQTVTSVLLLLAVYKNKRQLIPPWLVVTFVEVLLKIFFYRSTSFLFINFISPGQVIDLIRFLWAIEFPVVIYEWIVVFSYYQSASSLTNTTV